jgi:hypothetical protein
MTLSFVLDATSMSASSNYSCLSGPDFARIAVNGSVLQFSANTRREGPWHKAPRQPHELVAMALQERIVPDEKARHL